MTLAIRAVGTAYAGAGPGNPGLPAGTTADDLLVLVVATANTSSAVPTVAGSGVWSYAGSETGGGGTYGVGTGDRRLTYFTRVAVAGEAAPSVSLPAADATNAVAAQIIGLSKAATEAWAVVTAEFGAVTTSGTAWSQALTGIPSRMIAGALAVVGYAARGGTSVSAEGITATGATFGAVTERADTGTASGNGVRLAAATTTVSTGPATAAPVVTGTWAAATSGMVGVLVVLATTGSITAQQDYKGAPVRYNRLTNPSAENGTSTGWSGYGGVGGTTVVSVNAQEEGVPTAPSGNGSRVFKVTGPAGNNSSLGQTAALEQPITRGAQVHVRFDCYVPPGSPADNVQIILREDSTATTFNTVVMGALVPGQWTVYDTVVTITQPNELERLYINTVDTAGTRGVDVVYFDNVLCEQYTPGQGTSYVDGDTFVPGYVAVWAAAAQASGSLVYAATDPPRVGVTLSNWAQDAPTTVYRVNAADLSRTEVRGGSLTPSGGAAFVWDYEFPTNVEVYYVADDSGTERGTETLAEVIVRTNRATNPEVRPNTNGYTTNNGALYPVTYDATGGVGGGGAAVATFVGTPAANGAAASFYMTGSHLGPGTSRLPVVPGQRLRMSVNARVEQTPRVLTGSLTFYAADGTTVVATGVGTNSVPAAPPGQSLRVGAETADVPDSAAFAILIVTSVATNGDSQVANERTWVDQCLIEDRVGVQPFFSGDTRGVGYRWSSTVDQSTSQQYVTDVATPLIIPDTRSFLRSPGLPGLDMAVRFGRVPERSHPRPVTFLAPIGRRTLIPQSGARQAPTYPLDIVTFTDADAEALVALLADTAVAWLLFPGTRVDGTYVALSDLQEKPNATVGPQEVRWTVQATEVSRPAGGTPYDPGASWQTLRDTSSSWQAVLNSYPSWLDVLRGPGL